MELGAFSVSLAVKDIKASHEFYQKLGFKDFPYAEATAFAAFALGRFISITLIY